MHHHAFFDGSPRGYPGIIDNFGSFEQGQAILPPDQRKPLRGQEIPLAARIVALADVYDALRHIRSYKKSWTEEETFEEIKSQSGKQFDPELVEAVLQIRNRLEAINKALTPDEEC